MMMRIFLMMIRRCKDDITGVTSTAAKARARPDISTLLEMNVMMSMMMMMTMMMMIVQSHGLNPVTASKSF